MADLFFRGGSRDIRVTAPRQPKSCSTSTNFIHNLDLPPHLGVFTTVHNHIVCGRAGRNIPHEQTFSSNVHSPDVSACSPSSRVSLACTLLGRRCSVSSTRRVGRMPDSDRRPPPGQCVLRTDVRGASTTSCLFTKLQTLVFARRSMQLVD